MSFDRITPRDRTLEMIQATVEFLKSAEPDLAELPPRDLFRLAMDFDNRCQNNAKNLVWHRKTGFEVIAGPLALVLSLIGIGFSLMS